jgi:hypothetical protein
VFNDLGKNQAQSEESMIYMREKLRSENFIIVGEEVYAKIAGLPDRRYDFVVIDPQTNKRLGVEVKSTRVGNLKLNAKQVAFDAKVVDEGALSTRGQIEGVTHRGVSYSEARAANWSTQTLQRVLQAAKIDHKIDSITKPRQP